MLTSENVEVLIFRVEKRNSCSERTGKEEVVQDRIISDMKICYMELKT